MHAVTAYDPSKQFSLSAINMLTIGAADLHVLPNLESKLSLLQNSAGFELSGIHDSSFYTTSLVPKYINSWIKSSRCSRQPTWENFLKVLKEMKLWEVADQIEEFLTKSTAHLKNKQLPKPNNGIHSLNI